MPGDPPTASDPLREHALTRLQEAVSQLIHDVDHSERLVHDVLRDLEGHQAPDMLAWALTLLGSIASYRSNHRESIERYEAALEVARTHHDLINEARAFNGLSVAHHKLGDHARALELAHAGLRIIQTLGHPRGEASTMSNLGLLYYELGEYQQALDLHQRALEIERSLGGHGWLIMALNVLVDLHHLGRHAEVIERSAPLLLELHAHGIRQAEGIARTFLARTHLALGERREASEQANAALALHEAIGLRDYIALTLLTRAEIALSEQDVDRALPDLTRALQLSVDAGLKNHERDTHRVLADAHDALGDATAALRHFRRYHTLERELHAVEVERRMRVHGMQARMTLLEREAELERERAAQLHAANEQLSAAHEELTHRATHDALTDLVNRPHFETLLHAALHDVVQGRSVGFALLFCDLDHFKQVNDTHGHAVGDALLRHVAARLKGRLRGNDVLARLGGDEFTVLLRDVQREEDAHRLAQQLALAVRAPYDLDGVTVHVSVSIGVAICPKDGMDLVALQQQADAAMYHAKRTERGTVHSTRSATN